VTRNFGLILGWTLISGFFPGIASARAKPKGPFRVLEERGVLRFFRSETEAWPLEPGSVLEDASRGELDAGALLRLRYSNYLDMALAGPARFSVYGVPSPGGGVGNQRVVLKLDEGFLLVDGRFQFGRPADIVLGLPDRAFPLPSGQRFFVRVEQGRSALYVAGTGTARSLVPAELSAGAVVAESLLRPIPSPAVPGALFEALERPVRVFVIARDYNQDLGLWPHPAVLGPLLAERMAAIPGIEVVSGSGDTTLAYHANTALKSGQDAFLKDMALNQGARWVLAGNCVADTPPQESAPNLRRVRGQAEVRLLEADDPVAGMELVSEAAVTRVARAGRPMEQASREAFEAASDEVARYVVGHVEDLLQGRSHASVLMRLEADNMDQAALEVLRARLDSMDSVQRVFRRGFSKRVALFDLVLRKTPGDFDAQWAAIPDSDARWRWRTFASTEADLRRVRALRRAQ